MKPIYARNDDRHFLIRWGEKIFAVVMTILVWIFMITRLHYKLTTEAGDGLFQVFDFLLIGFGLTLFALILWQIYNYSRFHKRERRKEFRDHTLSEFGLLYGISAENMSKLQEIRKAAVVRFENNRYYYCIDGEPAIEIGMLRKED